MSVCVCIVGMCVKNLKYFSKKSLATYGIEDRLVARRSLGGYEICTAKRTWWLGRGGGSGRERRDGFEKCPADKMAWTGNGLMYGMVTELAASRFPGINWVISNS